MNPYSYRQIRQKGRLFQLIVGEGIMEVDDDHLAAQSVAADAH